MVRSVSTSEGSTMSSVHSFIFFHCRVSQSYIVRNVTSASTTSKTAVQQQWCESMHRQKSRHHKRQVLQEQQQDTYMKRAVGPRANQILPCYGQKCALNAACFSEARSPAVDCPTAAEAVFLSRLLIMDVSGFVRSYNLAALQGGQRRSRSCRYLLIIILWRVHVRTPTRAADHVERPGYSRPNLHMASSKPVARGLENLEGKIENKKRPGKMNKLNLKKRKHSEPSTPSWLVPSPYSSVKQSPASIISATGLCSIEPMRSRRIQYLLLFTLPISPFATTNQRKCAVRDSGKSPVNHTFPWCADPYRE